MMHGLKKTNLGLLGLLRVGRGEFSPKCSSSSLPSCSSTTLLLFFFSSILCKANVVDGPLSVLASVLQPLPPPVAGPSLAQVAPSAQAPNPPAASRPSSLLLGRPASTTPSQAGPATSSCPGTAARVYPGRRALAGGGGSSASARARVRGPERDVQPVPPERVQQAQVGFLRCVPLLGLSSRRVVLELRPVG